MKALSVRVHVAVAAALYESVNADKLACTGCVAIVAPYGHS